MKAGTLFALITAIVSIFGIFYFFSRKGRARSKVENINYPPFTIKKKNVYSTRYDINTANTVDNSRSYYSLYYQDQLISLPEALNQNTGVPGLWKVLILRDAPRPALLAGSKSVYLLTEAPDTYKITPVSEQHSDFARLPGDHSYGWQCF